MSGLKSSQLDRSRSEPADLFLPRLFKDIEGTPGDDRIEGTFINDVIDVSQGGDDTVNASKGNDSIYFGAAFTGADRVRGGAGIDTVTLDGDYSAGIEVQANSLVKIEQLVLDGGSYVIMGELNFEDTLGRTRVDARSLVAGQDLHLSVASLGDLYAQGGAGDDVVDGAACIAKDFGSFLRGGSGDDVLIGGAGHFELGGGLGADRLISNSDETILVYTGTVESTPKDFDTIERFEGKLWFLFDSDTSTPQRDHDFQFEKTADQTGDILFKYDAGADETIVKVFTDADHKADFVLHLTGDVPLTLFG